jgi:ribosomal protein L19E
MVSIKIFLLTFAVVLYIGAKVAVMSIKSRFIEKLKKLREYLEKHDDNQGITKRVNAALDIVLKEEIGKDQVKEWLDESEVF